LDLHPEKGVAKELGWVLVLVILDSDHLDSGYLVDVNYYLLVCNLQYNTGSFSSMGVPGFRVFFGLAKFSGADCWVLLSFQTGQVVFRFRVFYSHYSISFQILSGLIVPLF
jgi:hypothetical protein